MAENPSVTVSVIADIKALTSSMKEAETTVGRASTSMAQSVERADLGNRLNRQAMMFNKAANAMTFALQEFSREGMNAITIAEGVSQAAMMSGSKIASVAGGMVQLGMALNEFFTGAQAKARAMAEELKAMESESRIREETRDLERQLAILKEGDPVRKAELEMQRELARIRREARELDAKGADAAAREMIQAKEALAIEQGRQKIEAARKAQAETTGPTGAIGSIVDSLTTSIGNTFRIATRGAAAAMQQQQTQHQQTISANVAAILSMMRSQSGVIA